MIHFYCEHLRLYKRIAYLEDHIRGVVFLTWQTMYYNVTMKRVRATIVVVEKQYVLHILSVCL